MTNEQLASEIKKLGPWHIDIDVAEGLSTRVALEEIDPSARKVSFIDTKQYFRQLAQKLYPDGMKGKAFLDVACNCGAYSFWAKDLGADSTLSFDVRQHWIDQANFLLRHRPGNKEGMKFKIMDLYDLADLDADQKFDMTWFSGIFYHLPDPVRGLKVAADRTRDVIYVSTATLDELEEEPRNGCLFASMEGTEHLMSGVHHLNWFPSGPKVLFHILEWMGFPEAKVLSWTRRVRKAERPGDLKEKVGRIAIVAAREKGRLDSIEDARPQDAREMHWAHDKVAAARRFARAADEMKTAKI